MTEEFMNQLLQLRLTEIETREQIMIHAKQVHENGWWKSEGYPSFQAFCIDRLEYSLAESRQMAIAVGAILTSAEIRVDSPEGMKRVKLLKEVRRGWARAAGVPAYRIFSNGVLQGLAEANPREVEDLIKVKGFGPKKLEAFGTRLIAHLRTLN